MAKQPKKTNKKTSSVSLHMSTSVVLSIVADDHPADVLSGLGRFIDGSNGF